MRERESREREEEIKRRIERSRESRKRGEGKEEK